MTYDEWKNYIIEKNNKLNHNDPMEFYWPESDNFEKLTEPFIVKNNTVFKCYIKGVSTSEEIEKFIENSDNIGIYYIIKSNDPEYKFLMRFIDFNNDGLSKMSAEEFYQQNKEELTNGNTTIEEIKEHMNEFNDLGFIHVKKKKPESSLLRIERVLTDGDMIYE